MNKMKIEVSSRGVHPDSILIDGAGILHKVHWTTDGLVSDLVDGIERYVRKMLVSSHVYIVFDRYKKESNKVKNKECQNWFISTFSHLSCNKRLSPKGDMLIINQNKGKSD